MATSYLRKDARNERALVSFRMFVSHFFILFDESTIRSILSLVFFLSSSPKSPTLSLNTLSTPPLVSHS